MHYYIAKCECGAKMRTNSVRGELVFNESGNGVWSTPHKSDCHHPAKNAQWREVGKAEYDAHK